MTDEGCLVPPSPSSLAKAGVIGDLVADDEGEAWFGDVVKGAGPGVEVDLLGGVQVPQDVVEPADRQGGVVALQVAEQVRQGAVLRRARLLPAREVLEDRRPA